jgi:GTPase SAR1 family protein
MSGLDNAGKTTIVKKIMNEDVNTVSPTLGFIIKTIDFQGYGHFSVSTIKPALTPKRAVTNSTSGMLAGKRRFDRTGETTLKRPTP